MKESLSRIGSREREHHYHLKPEHRCYYWGDYTAWDDTRGMNADYSETNRLIADLKVPLDYEDVADRDRKLAAIRRVSEAFSRFWRWRDLADKVLLVPMPPSRSVADPLYDDRMQRIVDGIREHTRSNLWCAALLVSNGSLVPSHQAATRPKPRDLLRSIEIDSAQIPAQSPEMVFLFDDVLTTGAHFVACSAHIQRILPQARIIGNFVARTKRPSPNE